MLPLPLQSQPRWAQKPTQPRAAPLSCTILVVCAALDRMFVLCAGDRRTSCQHIFTAGGEPTGTSWACCCPENRLIHANCACFSASCHQQRRCLQAVEDSEAAEDIGDESVWVPMTDHDRGRCEQAFKTKVHSPAHKDTCVLAVLGPGRSSISDEGMGDTLAHVSWLSEQRARSLGALTGWWSGSLLGRRAAA